MVARAIVVTTCVLVLIPLVVGLAGGPGPSATPSASSQKPTVKLRSPVRIAMANNGNVFVSDHGNRQIVENKKGDFASARAFAVPGRPLGLAVIGGSVYVGNTSTRRVEVYNKAGNLQHILGGGDREILRPTDIAVDGNLIFVLDGGAKVG